MRGGTFLAAAGAALLLAAPLEAQRARQTVIASNGIEVSLYGDEFDAHREFGGPPIRDGDATYFASVVRPNTGPLRFAIGAIVSYRAPRWRFYDGASFRGGEAASFMSAGREVLSCRGSRYGGCSYMESFQIEITQSQLDQYGQGGVLTLKVGSHGTDEIMLNVPLDHFTAAREVAMRR